MDKRRTLKIVTTIAAIFGMASFVYPFVASLKPSAKAESESYITLKLPALETGVVKIIPIKGNNLLLLLPSKEQIQSISILENHVWNKTKKYDNELGGYVYWGHSTKWGCTLEHKEPQESLLKEWEKDTKWLGGYWDGWCEVSYDYAGRAIKTWKHTYNGYTFQHENLKVPTVFEKSGESYIVSIRQR
jgi:Rieske Fe-S protein